MDANEPPILDRRLHGIPTDGEVQIFTCHGFVL
jgi:hypothetical protein